jgi:4-amino-4-deoxy-L-arabinose transferase-like glycosyltransferase
MKTTATEPRASASPMLLLLTSPWFIVAVAFALRLENIVAHHLYVIPADQDHALFGFEMGRLARSIAQGKGFSAVFDASSGPTAWWTPVFPLLLGGIFKVFGVYSSKAALVIFALNSLFSALTCGSMFLIARETLGRMTAILSAWAWALLPYAIYWPTHHIWDTSLSAFLLTLAILCTMRMADSRRWVHWAGFGLLWGLIALTNAVMLSFLPVALLWIRRARPRYYLAHSRELAVFAIAVALVIGPWILRNERVMGKFIFPRSNLGFELYMGNHGEGYNRGNFWGPFVNPVERKRYDELGELAYMADKQKRAVSFIMEHPGVFALSSVKRAIFFWITPPDEYFLLRGRNMFRQSIFLVITLLGLDGLYLARKNRLRGAVLFGGVLFFYPLIYYVTHVDSRYYHPLAPIMFMLSAFTISDTYRKMFLGVPTRSKETAVSEQEPLKLASNLSGARLQVVTNKWIPLKTSSACTLYSCFHIRRY